MTTPTYADLQARLDHIQNLCRDYISLGRQTPASAYMLATGVLTIANTAIADPHEDDPPPREIDVVEGLLVQPGDTILIRLDPQTPLELVEDMQKRLAGYLPPDVKIVTICAEQAIQITRGDDR